MIIMVEGLNGAGKTYMTVNNILYPAWKQGSKIYCNFALNFEDKDRERNENIVKWEQLVDIYQARNGYVCIDEAKTFFNARTWKDTPQDFVNLLQQHRKRGLNFVAMSPSYYDIDVEYRKLVHERYECKSLFRYPRDDSQKPIFQIIKAVHKIRLDIDNEKITWKNMGVKYMFLSHLWTKTRYDTYTDVNLESHKLTIVRENGRWQMRIENREFTMRGR